MVYLPHWPIPSTLGKAQINYETVFERMSLVLEKLGNPHKKLPHVIHVAGTNGKGSVTSLLAKIFICAGYKTHIYTSPHLHECNERIVLNGEKISDTELFEVMEESRIAGEGVPLTFMEGFTIGAFLAFTKHEADIVIIECGMGGRIDATNIIDKKLASVITPISFDHVEYLGNSIERIALEKAMIIRPNTPLIVSSQSTKALEIIDILAKDQHIKTYYYDRDFAVMKHEENDEFDIEFFGKNKNFYLENLPKPALLGEHQYINFATAIAAMFAIEDHYPDLFQINENHVRQAISKVYWPSRLEKIENSLSNIFKNKSSELFIDGAHNEAGAFSLARWLLEKNEKDKKKIFVIVGFSRGKCKKEFLQKFVNIAEEIVAVKVDGEPYPENSEVIFEIANSINAKSFAAEDLLDALHHISDVSADEPCLVVICGSLHLARDVRKFGD
ncbi:MAG: bifunctional folylpolyglutamate synthase/dihydrofolate synthase [Rickettsiales bacterium]|nr:bifunctional folylpolyglutamate synthase/dihydrofolate synthase [Rickettsiales bacterium]